MQIFFQWHKHNLMAHDGVDIVQGDVSKSTLVPVRLTSMLKLSKLTSSVRAKKGGSMLKGFVAGMLTHVACFICKRLPMFT